MPSKSLITRIAIALLIAIPLTVLLFFFTAFASGACHCFTLSTITFPYGTITLDHTDLEWIGFLLIAIQFPIYGIAVAIVKGGRPRALVTLTLLGAHVVAALVGLKINR